MQDQPNDLDRVGQLEASVDRLTSEVSSLKLELATLISAFQENQFHSGRRPAVPSIPSEPPVRPSMAPAAIVVLVAAGLLSWQLIATQQSNRANVTAARPAAAAAPTLNPAAPAIHTAATEPPITPLVHPTIYKGTLSVNANHPGAMVFVNRQSVGPAPVRIRNLRAGAHLVWVEREGYRRWTRVITVPAERVTRVSADLEPVIED